VNKKPRGLLYGGAEHVLDVLDGLMPDLDAPAVQEQINRIVSLLAQEPQSILQKNPYFSGHPEDVIYRDIALGKVQAVVEEPRRFFERAMLNALEVASFEFLNQLAGGFSSYTEEWSERRPKLAGGLFSFLHHRNAERVRKACRKGHEESARSRQNTLDEKTAKRNQMILAKADALRLAGMDDRAIAGTVAPLFGISPRHARRIIPKK
jgi:hypothetical protein